MEEITYVFSILNSTNSEPILITHLYCNNIIKLLYNKTDQYFYGKHILNISLQKTNATMIPSTHTIVIDRVLNISLLPHPFISKFQTIK